VSSEWRTAEAAVNPWRRALSEERCLPAGVRGPVECCELPRLVAARAAGERWVGAIGAGKVMVIGDMWDLAIGIACGRGGGRLGFAEVVGRGRD